MSSTIDLDGKNPNNVAGGLKGTLKRDDISDETKQSAQRRLDELEDSGVLGEREFNTCYCFILGPNDM